MEVMLLLMVWSAWADGWMLLVAVLNCSLRAVCRCSLLLAMLAEILWRKRLILGGRLSELRLCLLCCLELHFCLRGDRLLLMISVILSFSWGGARLWLFAFLKLSLCGHLSLSGCRITVVFGSQRQLLSWSSLTSIPAWALRLYIVLILYLRQWILIPLHLWLKRYIAISLLHCHLLAPALIDRHACSIKLMLLVLLMMVPRRTRSWRSHCCLDRPRKSNLFNHPWCLPIYSLVDVIIAVLFVSWALS